MGMPQREVVVSGHRYKFYLIDGSKALEALRKFTAKTATLIPCLINSKIDDFNLKLFELITDDFDYLFDIFIDKNQLYCDDKIINDFDEHFAGRFTDIAKLLYKVVLENDKDFFHSLPTLIEKALHKLNERLQANSLPKAEGLETALNQVASSLKENLG